MQFSKLCCRHQIIVQSLASLEVISFLALMPIFVIYLKENINNQLDRFIYNVIILEQHKKRHASRYAIVNISKNSFGPKTFKTPVGKYEFYYVNFDFRIKSDSVYKELIGKHTKIHITKTQNTPHHKKYTAKTQTIKIHNQNTKHQNTQPKNTKKHKPRNYETTKKKKKSTKMHKHDSIEKYLLGSVQIIRVK